MYKLLVTGSSGLVGSEVVDYFCKLGWEVHGVDNNMRAEFFGSQGDTRWNKTRLTSLYPNFEHHELDIRNRAEIVALVKALRPALLVHAAGQPSHDLAASRPFVDFDVNAAGTLNLLEASRLHAPTCVFVYMSTNKVYGDGPNRIALKELATRWDYEEPLAAGGIGEMFPIDQTKHSLFGASKVAADVMVQEYGRYFGLPCCVLRAGCITGPYHSGVELHGFLSYLIKCNIEGRTYRIYGYKGKQVRDNIHAFDLARFIQAFWERPRVGEVYNIGGGRANSVSIVEAFDRIAGCSGRKMMYEYVDNNREGDHICYISNLSKIKAHYPNWEVTRSLDKIFTEICAATQQKKATVAAS